MSLKKDLNINHQTEHSQSNILSTPLSSKIMHNYQETFEEKGYVHVKEFIPREVAKYLFEYLKFSSHARVLSRDNSYLGDEQVPGSFAPRHGDLAFQALMKQMRPTMEIITGLDLCSTYTYVRLYREGNELKKHKDRPSCEISVTVKLSDTSRDGYNWPIFMEGTECILKDGDAVIYRGCDYEHWREVCKGGKKYRLGQAFLHYIDKNGPHYPEYAYDKQPYAKLFESEL